MGVFKNLSDLQAIVAEMPWEQRRREPGIYRLLAQTAARHGARSAMSFQLTSAPDARAETVSWTELFKRVTQCANMFHKLGVGPGDVVAYILPNSLETVEVLLGGMIAGTVTPINPLLEPEQIAQILRDIGAKVVVTLRAFPKSDLAQKMALALEKAPNVKTLIEVDLAHYLGMPKKWLVPFMRPKVTFAHQARICSYAAERARQPADRLLFEDAVNDRVAAFFHTGGTTGSPKVVQHRISGMLYNGWIGHQLLFQEKDTVMCPLPLFHVFAVYPILFSALVSGAHVVFPTPAGYRGEGVFDHFWKLIERWQVNFLISVPTALSALAQRPVDADISSLRGVLSGSAPLSVELFKKFESMTGVQVAEGYGMTECTCLVSCNPIELGATKKIGSVGLPFPYTNVTIWRDTPDGFVPCAVDEVGEICVENPGVFVGHTYTEEAKNANLYVQGRHLRTGDLGRLDADGYLFITGRAKDLIIRGGHNIDPAMIEETLMHHPAIGFAGAIGQPDAHAGEVPCAYVELAKGATVTADELMDYAKANLTERAAIPKHIEILPELPKTAVGKIFKPDLRRLAIIRVYDAALAKAGIQAQVIKVVDDPKRGLVARIKAQPDDVPMVKEVLGQFTIAWEV